VAKQAGGTVVFWKKRKRRLTGVNFSTPLIGGGASWEGTSDEREVRARSERADAFTALWTLVQEAHIGLRNDFDRVDELSEVHRQLNVLLIQQAPALEAADVAMAQDFLSALGKFISLLRPATGEEAARVRGEIYATMNPVFHGEELEELADTYARVEALNESLKQRYRSIVFAEDS
jgi:hypothetical protein